MAEEVDVLPVEEAIVEAEVVEEELEEEEATMMTTGDGLVTTRTVRRATTSVSVCIATITTTNTTKVATMRATTVDTGTTMGMGTRAMDTGTTMATDTEEAEATLPGAVEGSLVEAVALLAAAEVASSTRELKPSIRRVAKVMRTLHRSSKRTIVVVADEAFGVAAAVAAFRACRTCSPPRRGSERRTMTPKLQRRKRRRSCNGLTLLLALQLR